MSSINIIRRCTRAAALAGATAAALIGAPGGAYASPTTPATGAAVTPIALSSDWSGQAGFGSSSPGWFVDTSLVDPAVVHLQGGHGFVVRVP